MSSNDETPETSKATTTTTKEKHTVWIEHRSDGKSYGDHPELSKKPPLFCCWVPPCVKWCPTFFEQNPCVPCSCFGKTGCTDGQNETSLKSRRIVFTIGLVANLIGLALTIYSCFGISNTYSVLQKASYSKATVDSINATAEYQTVYLHLGLRSATVENYNNFTDPPGQGKVVVGFDNFCDGIGNGLERYLTPEDCNNCEDVSQSYVASVLSATVLYLPSIFTDVLRMYPQYDLNCQKFYGAIVATVSIILTLRTLVSYAKDCWDGFYDGQVYYFSNGTVVPEGYYSADEPTYGVDFDWEAGPAYITLAVATFLKLIDAICHFVVPTPSIAHDPEEQKQYTLDYGDDDANNKGVSDLQMEERNESDNDGDEEVPNGNGHS